IEENQSRNTFENLLFSKKIISDLNKTVVIVSNEYHILRCVIYAKNIGLSVVGVPSKTVRYYKTFGEFREVVAFIVRYKLLFFVFIVLSIISLYLDYL
ncbi:YdcF family protein, partial [Enterococcus faecium]|nr:YdcF family protein [Enterococcus faecium]